MHYNNFSLNLETKGSQDSHSVMAEVVKQGPKEYITIMSWTELRIRQKTKKRKSINFLYNKTEHDQITQSIVIIIDEEKVPVMGMGDSSMPSLLSLREDNLCQKPSSTELWNGANWSIDPHPLPLSRLAAITVRFPGDVCELIMLFNERRQEII